MVAAADAQGERAAADIAAATEAAAAAEATIATLRAELAGAGDAAAAVPQGFGDVSPAVDRCGDRLGTWHVLPHVL